MPLFDLAALTQVGIPFMDEDHRQEVELLNALAGAIADVRAGGGSRERLDACWEAVTAHTRAHFAREEEAMVKSRFPVLRIHQAEHGFMLEAMDTVKSDYQRSGNTDALWTYVSVNMPDWLSMHVSTMDAATAEYMIAVGPASIVAPARP